MGDKLGMHCKRPKNSALQYNRYVFNGNLFSTLAHEVEKRTHSSGMCVPTMVGETYYKKLTQIIEV